MICGSNCEAILKVAFSLLIFSSLEDVSNAVQSSECLRTMKNLVVHEGDKNILLNLTTTDPTNVKWTVIPTSDEFGTYVIQDYGGKRDSSLMELFDANQDGLVVREATAIPTTEPISTAGLYLAQCANNSNMTGAKLVVVIGAPECSCNASSPTDVQLLCSIAYADGTLHPINANMTWTIGDVFWAAQTPVRTRINYYVFESTSKLMVDSSISANYECTVSFNTPTDVEYDFIAMNAPQYRASCSVSACHLTSPSDNTTTTPPLSSTTSTTVNSSTTVSSTTISGGYGSCSTPPVNQAVYAGTLNTLMTCDSSSKESWILRPTSDELSNARITNYDDTVSPSYTNLFGFNQTGLVVRTAETTPAIPPVSTSGLYVVRINGSSTKFGAKLVVIRQEPYCSCNVFNSTSIRINCSIVYADSTYHPIDAKMTWTSNGNFYTIDTPVRTKANPDEFISTSSIIVDGYYPPNYQCVVTFATPRDQQFPFVAKNAPTFSATCTPSYCGITTASGSTSTTLVPPTTISMPPLTTTVTQPPSTTPSTINQQPPTTPSTTTQQPPTTPSTINQQPPTASSTINQQPPTASSTTNQQPPTASSTTNQQPSTTSSTTNQQPPTTPSTPNQQPSTTTQPPSSTTQLLRRSTRLATTPTQPPTITLYPPTSTADIITPTFLSTTTLDLPEMTSRRYTKALSTAASPLSRMTTPPAPGVVTSSRVRESSTTPGCNCALNTACTTPDANCNTASECQNDGTNLSGIYSEGVVKAELYARFDKCCPKSLVWGVVVTLRNNSVWLIHDPMCSDNKCEMAVVNASCMSSAWSLLSDRRITTSEVGDYVQTGNAVQNNVDTMDCSESCRRMMNLS